MKSVSQSMPQQGTWTYFCRVKNYYIFLIILFNCSLFAQQTKDSTIIKQSVIEEEADSTRAYIGQQEIKSEMFQKDSLVETPNDISPLDIGSNRGIFILSANKLLQLRILGSVRSNFHYTDQDLNDRNTFNPFEIPTRNNRTTPIYFAGFNQTRLGFEVTRRTASRGDIFVRLEADFKGPGGAFRVRHAYGEIGRFLVGMTWSLTNNVGYQPAIVSMDGPVGGIGLRTPQLRYTQRFNDKIGMSLGIEYSQPQVIVPENVIASVVQLLPDFTARFTYNSDRFSMRFSSAFTTISGRVFDNNLESINGYLLSLAGKVSSFKGGDFYFGLGTGKGTSHFFDTFNGKNSDLVFDPIDERFETVVESAGYLAYSHALPKNLSASVSVGASSLSNKDFQLDEAFSHSFNALFNIFWQPADGARLGIEYANGKRFDKGDRYGTANRVSLLMYYDF